MPGSITRRELVAAGLAAGAVAAGSNSLAQEKEVVPARERRDEMGELRSVRCYHMVVPWDGTDRRTPATVKATIADANAGSFNSDEGVYIQQTPGGGNWHEVAKFKGISLSDSEFSMEFTETGGQNYNIWIPIRGSLTNSDITAASSGALRIHYKNIVDAPFP